MYCWSVVFFHISVTVNVAAITQDTFQILSDKSVNQSTNHLERSHDHEDG